MGFHLCEARGVFSLVQVRSSDVSGSTSDNESCVRLSLDSNNNPLALCYTDGSLVDVNSNNVRQPVLVKTDSSGVFTFIKHFGDNFNNNPLVNSISSGNIIQDDSILLGNGLSIGADGTIYFGSYSSNGFASNHNNPKLSGSDNDIWLIKLKESGGTLSPLP